MWPFSPSSAEVGSSAKISFGFLASARAMATRCFSPPDSLSGRLLSRWPRPTSISAVCANVFRSAGVQLHELEHDLDLLRRGQRRKQVEALKDEPAIRQPELVDRDFGIFQIFWPSAVTVPSSGRSRPDTAASKVDLPEPDGPMTSAISPGSISRSMFLSTSTFCEPERKPFFKPRASSAHVFAFGDRFGRFDVGRREIELFCECVAHFSRSAGSPFLSAPRVSAPEPIEIRSSRIAVWISDPAS